MRSVHQIDEQFFFHHIRVHKNGTALGCSPVGLQGKDTLLLVQVQGGAVQEMLLGVVGAVIQQGNVRSGFDMGLQQSIKILHIDHVAGTMTT